MPAAASALRRRAENSAFSSFMHPTIGRARGRTPNCGLPGHYMLVPVATGRARPARWIRPGLGGKALGKRQFRLLRQPRFLPFFVTPCLGALNDNGFRQAIIGLLFWMQAPADQRTLYASLAPAVFILPYFLFSATAGQIAEKLEKARLIRITTAMEIAIMSFAAVGFVLQSLPLLLVALFCTGVQSTLFGPVKYAILPSVLRPEELTGGNGLVEMGTSVSILLGMIAGGLVFAAAGTAGPWAAGAAVVALAIAGNLASRWIPPAGA